jgi:hypothetical protein
MAIDHKPVHLIFLILYSPAQQTMYINFVASLMRLLRNSEYMQAIMTAKTGDEIFGVLDSGSKLLVENHAAPSPKVSADPAIAKARDAHAGLVLLARLQLYQEMLEGSRVGKGELRERIEKTRALVDPRILKHYDRLMQGRPPAVVPVEGDTCQGCYMKLPSKSAQQVRQDVTHIHTCSNCSRFIYVV